MKPQQKKRSFIPQPSAADIAQRIRSLRRERGWSLVDVERLSHGTLKAVVLGSYERGDRALSLNRAIEIASIFSVPLHHLLAAPEELHPAPVRPRMVVDLRRARTLVEDPDRGEDRILTVTYTFLTWIARRRGDWNGEVMSLRECDHATLALMLLMTEEALDNWLNANRLLVTELNHS